MVGSRHKPKERGSYSIISIATHDYNSSLISSDEEYNFYGGYMPKQKIYFIGTLVSVLFLTSVARAEVSDETAYILNSFLF